MSHPCIGPPDVTGHWQDGSYVRSRRRIQGTGAVSRPTAAERGEGGTGPARYSAWWKWV